MKYDTSHVDLEALPEKQEISVQRSEGAGCEEVMFSGSTDADFML